MRQKSLLKLVFLLFALIVGTANTWAQTYEKVMELDVTGKTYGTSNYNASTTYGDWTIVNGANNNKQWNYFKMGGKSATLASNNPCYIYSTVATSSQVDKITVHLPSGSLSKNGMSVNSWGVYVYSDAAMTTQIDYVAGETITNSEGSFDFTPSTGVTWASGYYYKVSWDLANTTTTNGVVCVDKITLYQEVSVGTAVATTTTIDDSGITNTDVYTGTAAGSLSASTTETESGDAVSGATVTWSGDNDAVATIASDGTVTLVGVGNVTFTASYAGVANEYQASSATYELEVTSSAPYVQPTEFDINLNNSLFGTNYSGSVSNITDENPINGSQDNISVTYAGSGNHYVNNNQIRFYPSNKLTFEAPDGYVIEKIVFTAASTTWAATISANSGTYTSGTKTWEGNAASVLFTGSGSSRCDMSKATITLGQASTDPSIGADDVNLDYDATVGSITYTLNNEVTGGVVAAASSEGWLTVGTPSNGTVALTCSANEANTARTATVTLTYTYGDNQTVTKDVTVTQAAAPVIYSTIPALFEAAGSTAAEVLVTFNNWVVSGVSTNGKSVFVTDNEGNGFVIFDNDGGLDNTYTVGDILSGTAVSCNLVKYNGFAELTGLDASNLTINTGGTVSEANVAMADLAGVNTGALVHYDNLTCSVSTSNNNTYYRLSNGATTIQLHNSLFAFNALEDGQAYNITGVYQQYNSTKEILPRSADDIQEVVDNREEAEIAFSVATLTMTEGDTYTAPTFNNPNNVTVEFTTTASSVASWNNGLVLGGSTGTATITATFEGDANYLPATATLTVTVNEDLNFAPVVVGSGIYQKITSTTELEAGHRYLIVYDGGDDAKVFDGVTNNIGAYVALSIDDNKINNNVTDAATPVVLQAAGSDNWYIMDGNDFLYWTSGNNLYSSDDVSQSGNTWTIGLTSISNVNTPARYLQYNTGNPRFACYTGSQKNVVLYKELPITLNASGYATYASTYALDFFGAIGYTAWQITTVENDKEQLTLQQVTGSVQGGTGILLKGNAGATVYLTSTDSGEALTDNLLEGITTATVVTTGAYYGLSGDRFVKVNGGTVPAGKALLPASEVGSAKSFVFNFVDETTGISTIEKGQLTIDNAIIYDLQGRRVQNPTKGIYVVNGRKVVIK